MAERAHYLSPEVLQQERDKYVGRQVRFNDVSSELVRDTGMVVDISADGMIQYLADGKYYEAPLGKYTITIIS